MSDEIKVQSKNKKTKLIVAIAAAVIAVLTIVAIVVASSNSATAQKVKEQLSLGDKYLSELQYEQAIAAYELAIEIDPKCEDAYLGLAEVYIATGEFDKAEDILDKAEDALGKETDGIKELREKIKKSEEKISQEVQTPTGSGVQTPDGAPTPNVPKMVKGTFKLQVTSDGVEVEAENFKVTQNYATGEIKITLSGILIRDSYITNKSTAGKNYLEYGWNVKAVAENYKYGVSTSSWAFDPGQEMSRNVSEMQHSIWEYNDEERSFNSIGWTEVEYTSESMTWIFTMPGGYTLDIREIQEYEIGITENCQTTEMRQYTPSTELTITNPNQEPEMTPEPVPEAGITSEPVQRPSKVTLDLGSDGFVYETYEGDYVCTGLSEKGYAEYQKYDETCEVSILLPAVSDEGKEVVGFYAVSKKGYGLKQIMKYNSADIELVCPETYTVYYGFHKDSSFGKDKLKNVVLNDGLKEIKQSAFANCKGLTEIRIPESVQVIETFAFVYCDNLVIKELDVGGKTIGQEAFREISIGTLKVSDTVQAEEKASSSFSKATIENVEFSEKLNEIPADLFRGSNVKSVKIPSNIKKIGKSAFSGCTQLRSLEIEAGVEEIGDYAFGYCIELEILVLPESVKKIGEGSFRGCSGLKELVLPDSVESFGDNAFSGCEGLQLSQFEVEGKTFGCNVFAGVTIDKLKVSGMTYMSNPSSYGGFLTEAKIGEVELGNTLQEIPEYLFEDCLSITEITLPKTVQKIGKGAFYCCSNLTSIDIPEGTEEIGGMAFAGCVTLKRVNLPESVKNIGFRAFESCTKLSEIKIPAEVQAVGDSAFMGCVNLVLDEFDMSGKELGGAVFNGVTIGKIIISKEPVVESDSYSTGALKGAKVGSVELTGGLKNIPGSLFRDCESIVSIEIPGTVEMIGYRAFSGCTKLEKLVIPNSVTHIVNYAFSDCPNLTIYAKEGSYAADYAANKGVPVEFY